MTGDEILVTTSTATAAGLTDRDLGEARAVSLKGFAEPVDVRTVRWRGEPSSRVDAQ